MKRIIIPAMTFAVLAGLVPVKPSQAQNGGSGKKVQHRIGLIDMAEVFKRYKKFEALREDLKADIETSDREAKALAAQAQDIKKQLQTGNFSEDSPDYKRREDQLIQLKSQFQAFQTKTRREFLRKESQIYKTVYLEVADAVRKYAEYYDYTLVLRYNRNALEEADKPQKVLQSMNRQVIYSRKDDDITDPVIEYLNRVYERSQNGDTTATKDSGTRSR